MAVYRMWRIDEHRRVDRQVASIPKAMLKRYEKWKDIAALSGRFLWTAQKSEYPKRFNGWPERLL